MRTLASISLLAAAVGTGFSLSAPAALSAQQPTFRSSASIIEVDVSVRDGAGRFVSGLTADDFEIFEDGAPQPVQQFYVVTSSRDAPLSNPGVDPSGARRPNRMFVLLFDQDHLSVESLHRLKRAAEAFITTELRGDDVAGIVADRRIVGGRLTSSRPELLAAVKGVMPYPDSRAMRLKGLRDFPKIDSEFEAVRIAGGDVRVLQEATERVCRQAPQLCLMEGGNEIVMERIDLKARQYVDEARAASGNLMQTLASMSKGLARFPGRKTLIVMSEGFFVEESRPAVQQIAAQAARSGVTVYSLDGRGLAGSGSREMADATTPGSGLSRAFDSAGDGLAILAGGTGGLLLTNASNFAGALMDIARDTSEYYVIGYAPSNQALDGKFRKIEVKTRAKDVSLRARRGYLATPLPPQATLRGGG